jgi:Uma2 family endonuclease
MSRMQSLPSPKDDVPPLEPGDKLTRAEFERRYEAMPGVKKAELIEGVVYMPSPVSHDRHARPHADFVTLLGTYRWNTPGVDGGDNGTVRLDLENEPQPDAYLLIDPECGGQAKISEDGYIEDAPELVAEISSSSVRFDLHTKFAVYLRTGVRECIVWRVADRKVDWFANVNDDFVPLNADADGVVRSRVFPGLWLDATALVEDNMTRVFAVLQQGLASPEHAEFVRKLESRRGSK